MNRETWLNEITQKYLKDHFNNAGYTIPANIRMSCSLTSGRGAKNKAIGLCFSDLASDDNTHEIFISPSIDDSIRVVDILIHEIIHATIGLKEGHGKNFRKCAIALGLTGKMTATIASPELKEKIKTWVNDMGLYPHAKLNSTSNSGGKKQSTRLIKCQCECGYNIRITRKWLNELGAPICPACNIQMQ